MTKKIKYEVGQLCWHYSGMTGIIYFIADHVKVLWSTGETTSFVKYQFEILLGWGDIKLFDNQGKMI